jgi:5-methylcytosine-specific restriction protein A
VKRAGARRQDHDGRWLARHEGRRPLTKAERASVFSRDGYHCKKCGFASPRGTSLDVHHIVEVIHGGSDEPDNLDTLCCSCHAEWTWCQPEGVSYATWLTVPPARWLSMFFAVAPAFPAEKRINALVAEARAAFWLLRAELNAGVDWSAAVDRYTPRRPRKKERRR